jgi:intein-encoded DNA endonuclease-like protein
MRNEIGSEKPLKYIDNSNRHDGGYHYKNMWQLDMFSKHMCDALNNLGMVPNKSLKVTFPRIEKTLYSSFIRGVFDGDGCIHNSTKQKQVYNCSIVGTFDLCYAIQDICKEQGIESHIREASNHNGITAVFEVYRRDSVMKFLNYIYSGAEMFLERKYQRYLKYLESYNLSPQ